MSDSDSCEVYRRRSSFANGKAAVVGARKACMGEPRRRMSSSIQNRIYDLAKKNDSTVSQDGPKTCASESGTEKSLKLGNKASTNKACDPKANLDATDSHPKNLFDTRLSSKHAEVKQLSQATSRWPQNSEAFSPPASVSVAEAASGKTDSPSKASLQVLEKDNRITSDRTFKNGALVTKAVASKLKSIDVDEGLVHSRISVQIKNGEIQAAIDARELAVSSPDPHYNSARFSHLDSRRTSGSESDKPSELFLRRLQESKDKEAHLSGIKKDVTNPFAMAENESKLNSIKDRIRNLNKKDLTDVSVSADRHSSGSVSSRGQDELFSPTESDFSCRRQVDSYPKQVIASKLPVGVKNAKLQLHKNGGDSDEEHGVNSPLDLKTNFSSSTREAASKDCAKAETTSNQREISQEEPSTGSKGPEPIDVHRAQTCNNETLASATEVGSLDMNGAVALYQGVNPVSRFPAEPRNEGQTQTIYPKNRGDADYSVGRSHPAGREQHSPARRSKLYQNLTEKRELDSSSKFSPEHNQAEVETKTLESLKSGHTSSWSSDESYTDVESNSESDKQKGISVGKSDSSVTSDGFPAEKGQVRRRRLVKRAKKGRSSQGKLFTKKSNQNDRLDHLDTASDGDVRDSSDPEFSRSRGSSFSRCETDVMSDDDVYLKEGVNMISSGSADRENTRSSFPNSNLHSTDRKNSPTVSEPDPGYLNRLQESTPNDQGLTGVVEVTVSLDNEFESEMKSASMTNFHTAKFPVFTSLSSSDMAARFGNSEKGNKLAILSQLRSCPGPFGSISSVSKVSKLTLQSFSATAVLGQAKYKQNLSDSEEPYSALRSDAYRNSGILSSPFSIRKHAFGGDRFSDGEHEITSRLGKRESNYVIKDTTDENQLPDFCVPFTLPRSSRLRTDEFNDFAKGPVCLRVPYGNPSDSFDSATDALRNLPNSPFSLLGRFTEDTEKMLSRSTGSSKKTTASLEQNLSIDSDFYETGVIEENGVKESDAGRNSEGTGILLVTDLSQTIPSAIKNMENNGSFGMQCQSDLQSLPVNSLEKDIFLCSEKLSGESMSSVNDRPSIPALLVDRTSNAVVSCNLSPTQLHHTAADLQDASNETENLFDMAYSKFSGKLRRPSYIKARCNDEDDDDECVGGSISTCSIDKAGSSDVDKDMTGIREASGKRPPKRSRPRLPVVFYDGETNLHCLQEMAAVSAEQAEGSADLVELDFTKSGKQEPSVKRVRPRGPVAHQSFLENIPEEKGQGSVKIVLNLDDHEKRRRRKPNLAPVFAEEAIPEDVEDVPDSPKTDHDDKSETGYCSQGSDCVGTPKDLSLENLSSSDLLGDEPAHDEMYADTSSDAARSKSDPIPKAVIESKLLASVYPLSSASISEASLPYTARAHDHHDVADCNGTSVDPALSYLELEDKSKAHRSNDIKDDVLRPLSTEAGVDSSYEAPMSPTLSSLPVSALQADGTMSEEPLPSPAERKKKTSKPEMRRHVLQNLLETENSYVQNLSSMVTMFYKPLKRPENANIIESSLVDEIFFQIPEILVNHEFFLEQLTNRVSNWHDKQIIGDIFVSSFTKCLLMDAYSSFINHFLQAKSAIRQATSARPQFTKYIEQCYREHREKLTLSDLLIMPVQRIPRYVLILKDMLKHTPVEHPDYGNLQLALGEIKTLADRMNKGELEADQAERDLDRLRDIEATIEGITDLVAANRKFVRQDLVAEIKGAITKKDRCLFLFSDLLVCTAVRKKNNALRRGSLGLFTGQSAAELNRYKFLWRLSLEDVDVAKASSQTNQWGANKDLEKLEEDLKALSSMCASADCLSVQHQRLDQVLRELMSEVSQQVADRQTQVVASFPPTTTRIELQVQTEVGPDVFMFIFLSAECKTSWEAYFDDAKQKLSYVKNSFPPEFQCPLPITKTRSGMQFTCAAPSHVSVHGERTYDQSRGDVWICNSDGYVGQVCLLSVIPEAALKSSLSVCSARIVCISAVPGTRMIGQLGASDSRSNLSVLDRSSSATRRKPKSSKGSLPSLKQKRSFPSESDDEDMSLGAESIIAFDSSDDDDADAESAFIGGSAAFGGRMSPDGSSLGTVESDEGDGDSSDDENFRHGSSDDDDARGDSTRRMNLPLGASMTTRGDHDYRLKGGVGALLSDEDEQPTMWLGTEDGSIYVYHANDPIQQRKSKMKLSLGATVNSILYFENKVFVALGSGELCVYKRDADQGWNVAEPEKIQVGQASSPVACVTTVAGRVWCGCQNMAVIVHASTLKVEHTITVSPDQHRSVYKMVSSGLGVWISLQSSAMVRLYHATTYENLADIDVAPCVHKMLAGADAIIRQHKAACLRITSLLICKDLLWIGTSAGVILTNPLPNITVHTSVLKSAPGPSGSPHGHTGHVRFLSLVEAPKSLLKSMEQEGSKASASPSPSNRSFKSKDDACGKSGTKDNGPSGCVTLVVSGGDGYEDFRTNAQTEAVGRDDSTNHVLLWRV